MVFPNSPKLNQYPQSHALPRSSFFSYKLHSTMKTPISHKRKGSSVEPDSARRSSPRSGVYPFSAMVGQDEMKLALILNVVDPLIGGVLIMGHRGTGKSTAVRALADLLPEITVVSGCAYRCDPKDQENLCEECKAKVAKGQ